MMRYWKVLILTTPLILGFRVLPGGNGWAIHKTDPTLWVKSCRKLTFTSAEFKAGDPLAAGEIPSYDAALQSILTDYNSIQGAYIHLALYPDDPNNPPAPDPGTTAFTTATANERTIDLCFEDQTITAGHASPEWDEEKVTGCKIRLNTDQVEKAEDFVSVLTHELGHCLGLDHPQETDDAIMSYFSTAHRLQIDDKMGIVNLYPAQDSFGDESPTLGLSCSPK